MSLLYLIIVSYDKRIYHPKRKERLKYILTFDQSLKSMRHERSHGIKVHADCSVIFDLPV